MQRFLHTNLVSDPATLLSATGTQSGFPSSWIKDQLLSKAWRSPAGWTVVLGFNDKLDFTEAGVARVATLTAGTYSTGASMASAAQTAMNAAPGAVNTYTVTYDAGTKKFTIARATGAAAVVLKCAVGATNFASSTYLDLGFLNTDRSGASSYVADIAVYQSRHAIFLDLGQSTFVTCSAVAIGGVLGVFTVQGNGSTLVGVGARASVSAEQPLSTGTLIPISYVFSDALRYWRLIIDSRVQTQGYSEVPVWFLGEYSEPSVCTSVEFHLRIEQLSTVEYAKSGAHYQDLQAQRRAYGLSWLEVVEADRLIFETIQAACPLGKNFFLTLDIALANSTTYYGFLRAGIEEQYVPHPYWNIPLEFAVALP
jgi:hypothetical protein